MDLPVPYLLEVDETSICLALKPPPTEGITSSGELFLEYKLPHQDWSKGASVPVEIPAHGKDSRATVLVADLLPGTPYIVRLAHRSFSGQTSYGEEIVFDTAPVDCTPKRKKCNVS